MEFSFNLNDVFKSSIVEITPNLIPPGYAGDRRALWDTVSKVGEIVNQMGAASAAAQGLNKAITTADRIRNSEHKLYFLIDQKANSGKGAVTGMLKTGNKSLYVFDRDGNHYQVQPPCLLDFYVHESKQRNGLGKVLFEHMLQKEGIAPVQMAIDRPSEKLLGFLNKHYSLRDPVKQMNNYVVFDDFFPRRGLAVPEPQQEGGLRNKNNPNSANGLQPVPSPMGRYGAPRPPCSMGQIIHNQSPSDKRQEISGVQSIPTTNYQGYQQTYSPNALSATSPNAAYYGQNNYNQYQNQTQANYANATWQQDPNAANQAFGTAGQLVQDSTNGYAQTQQNNVPYQTMPNYVMDTTTTYLDSYQVPKPTQSDKTANATYADGTQSGQTNANYQQYQQSNDPNSMAAQQYESNADMQQATNMYNQQEAYQQAVNLAAQQASNKIEQQQLANLAAQQQVANMAAQQQAANLAAQQVAQQQAAQQQAAQQQAAQQQAAQQQAAQQQAAQQQAANLAAQQAQQQAASLAAQQQAASLAAQQQAVSLAAQQQAANLQAQQQAASMLAQQQAANAAAQQQVQEMNEQAANMAAQQQAAALMAQQQVDMAAYMAAQQQAQQNMIGQSVTPYPPQNQAYQNQMMGQGVPQMDQLMSQVKPQISQQYMAPLMPSVTAQPSTYQPLHGIQSAPVTQASAVTRFATTAASAPSFSPNLVPQINGNFAMASSGDYARRAMSAAVSPVVSKQEIPPMLYANQTSNVPPVQNISDKSQEAMKANYVTGQSGDYQLRQQLNQSLENIVNEMGDRPYSAVCGADRFRVQTAVRFKNDGTDYVKKPENDLKYGYPPQVSHNVQKEPEHGNQTKLERPRSLVIQQDTGEADQDDVDKDSLADPVDVATEELDVEEPVEEKIRVRGATENFLCAEFATPSPRKNPSHLTEKGYVDLKFYHNKLW